MSLIAALAFLLAALPNDGIKLEAATPQSVAEEYFKALISGDAKRSNELSTVPYSMDGKQILKTREELDAMHASVVRKKGARPVPKHTVQPVKDERPLEKELFPKYEVFSVEIPDGQRVEKVYLYVLPGLQPKVIGLKD